MTKIEKIENEIKKFNDDIEVIKNGKGVDNRTKAVLIGSLRQQIRTLNGYKDYIKAMEMSDTALIEYRNKLKKGV